MTHTQIHLAIGIPVVLNATFLTVAIMLLSSHINSRFDAVNKRFDDMRDLWRAELRRVADVLDARPKHIGEREKA